MSTIFLPGVILIALMIAPFGAGCSSREVQGGPDGDGGDAPESETDADSEMDEESESCLEESAGCDGTVMTVCIHGVVSQVADCAARGWSCLEGSCVAAGEETETQTAYRTRLNTLRQENARTKMELDRFGGWINAPESFANLSPGQFFRVQEINGTWWFITPEGHPFISKGVTDVNYLGANLSGDSFHQILVEKYEDEEDWADASLMRLKDWFFNSIGPWSGVSMTRRLPHAFVILDSAGHAPRHTSKDVVTDYWSSGFEQWSYQVVIDRATPYVNDEHFIGYFLDNELFWGPDWRTDKTMLQAYLDFPVEAPGRIEALRFIKEQAFDLDDFNSTWGTTLANWDVLPDLTSDDFVPTTDKAQAISEAFAVHAFARYARIAMAGVRAVDPNHLILGCRFAAYPGDALVRASAQVFDVISMAGYHENWVDELDAIYPDIHRPFIIEEFSFKAKDSGLPNVMNYAIVVETQKDRAMAYEEYVESFIRRPYAVMYHWYKWFDNPTDGFLAGDNFGLMNGNDDPYQDFVTFIREVNFRAETWHAEGEPETR